MNDAELVASVLLETEQYDAHVKAYDRLKHWDGAVDSFKKLMDLKKQAMEKMTQIGTALGYERALAYAGLEKADVERPIRGRDAAIRGGYTGTEQVKGCTNPNCELRFTKFNSRTHKSVKNTNCVECGGPVQEFSVPIPRRKLELALGSSIVGVETKDGRTVWFKEPVE